MSMKEFLEGNEPPSPPSSPKQEKIQKFNTVINDKEDIQKFADTLLEGKNVEVFVSVEAQVSGAKMTVILPDVSMRDFTGAEVEDEVRIMTRKVARNILDEAPQFIEFDRDNLVLTYKFIPAS